MDDAGSRDSLIEDVDRLIEEGGNEAVQLAHDLLTAARLGEASTNGGVFDRGMGELRARVEAAGAEPLGDLSADQMAQITDGLPFSLPALNRHAEETGRVWVPQLQPGDPLHAWRFGMICGGLHLALGAPLAMDAVRVASRSGRAPS